MPPRVSSAISVVYGDQQGSAAAAAVEGELVHTHPYQGMNLQSRMQFVWLHT